MSREAITGRGLTFEPQHSISIIYYARYLPAIFNDPASWQLVTLDWGDEVEVRRFDSYPALTQAMERIVPLRYWLTRHWEFPERRPPKIYIERE